MKEQSLTLRLPGSMLQWSERSAGGKDPSEYILTLVEQRMKEVLDEDKERSRLMALGCSQYSVEVCRQTLEINDQFPIHDE